MSVDSSAKKPVIVDLFYDVRSPFTWFGFEALIRYSKQFPQIKLILKPVSLIDIGRATGNSTPMNIPAKGQYFAKDLMRLAEYFQMPFHLPEDVRNVMFVKGTHAALCLLTVVAEKHPEYLESLSREFFMKIWSKDEDVTMHDSLKQACSDAGLPSDIIESLIKESQSPDVENTLKKTSEEAIGYGAFGLPSYVAHFEDEPKMFFGTDRLFMLCFYLNEPYPGPLNHLKPSKL